MNDYKDYNKYTSQIDYSLLIEFLMQTGTSNTYNKGDYFVRMDEKSKYMGYVVSGAFRYSAIMTDGRSRIVGYSFKNGFVGNYPSFLHNMPSTFEIQAICDSMVYSITYEEMDKFYSLDPTHQQLRTQIAETLLLENYDRLIAIYTMSPKEQYLEIVGRCPELLNMITLKELASYLMITPETLSRIRKEIVSK